MNNIEQKFYQSKQFFKTNKTKELKFRKHQLKILRKSIKTMKMNYLKHSKRI